MGYVSVSGGAEAISEAEKMNRYYRLSGSEASIDVAMLGKQLRLLADRIMSEGGLYAPGYAALALKQSEGDPFEAAFLVRAYRSTLARNHYSYPVDTSSMRTIRRISSSFRDLPGGQMLGPTYDYTHRMLNFDLLREEPEQIRDFLEQFAKSNVSGDGQELEPRALPKVVQQLREEGLLPEADDDSRDEKPADITKERVKFPYPRSARLQALARGETGMMVSLAYSAMRGYGSSHPTIGELRVGHVGICIPHPYEDSGEEADAVYLGEMLLTEVETINAMAKDERTGRVQFRMGYGVCFGHNELKAISMAILDSEMRMGGHTPPQDEEFVLMHIDSVDSSGFVSHLKLPHYVTFRSKLDVLRNGAEQRKGGGDEDGWEQDGSGARDE